MARERTSVRVEGRIRIRFDADGEEKNFYRRSDWRIRAKAHEFSREDVRAVAFPRVIARGRQLRRALRTTALPNRVTLPKTSVR